MITASDVKNYLRIDYTNDDALITSAIQAGYDYLTDAIDDFDLLLRIGVFNRAYMNDAILKFRRYEDASLAYTGVNRHASDTRIGLMDSTVPIEALVSEVTYPR